MVGEGGGIFSKVGRLAGRGAYPGEGGDEWEGDPSGGGRGVHG